jgi:hypothetical protein
MDKAKMEFGNAKKVLEDVDKATGMKPAVS